MSTPTQAAVAAPAAIVAGDLSEPAGSTQPATAGREVKLSPFATRVAAPRPAAEDAPGESTSSSGRLVIVGSGIRTLGQMTFEALGHIEAADEVFYAVADPLVEAFIERHARCASDLCMLYDEDKPRMDTYVQMAEVIMRAVRRGRYVVGVFYGHPGVFVTPSHRAMAIARQEGYRAEMLAGVSAEDNLFADIGFDPSHPGCQTLEATEMLRHGRPLLTDLHVVLFQVGAVGDQVFNFNGFRNPGFQTLIDRLIAEYGEEHDVYHYVASMYAPCRPVVRRHRLADFRDPDLAKRVTVVSTFYVPPRGASAPIAQAIARGLSGERGKAGYAGANTSEQLYGPAQQAAIARLDGHRISSNYRRRALTDSMYETMYALATNPSVLHEYERAPDVFLSEREGLRAEEREALRAPGMRALHDAMLESQARADES
ncbi:SAM-dependent methyltransferase [Trinickia dinghuensis]|nr:SAM-dependent methyltransferase [Trinickia dinghuensis]